MWNSPIVDNAVYGALNNLKNMDTDFRQRLEELHK